MNSNRVQMNEEDHKTFVENFINDKKTSNSPLMTQLSFRSNNEELEIPATSIKDCSPKLLKYKNHVLKALKQNQSISSLTSNNATPELKSSPFFFDLSRLPPLVKNNIKMFVTKIRKMGYLNNISVLSSFDLKLINDYAYYKEEVKKLSSSKRSFFYEFISNMVITFKKSFNLRKFTVPVIHPYGKIKLLWDTMISLLIIFLMFYIPFQIAFESEVFDQTQGIYCSGLLLADMTLEMNTLFFYHGALVENRKKIIINYLKTYFFPDVMAFFSVLFQVNFIFDFGSTSFSYFSLFFFMKLFTLMKVSKRMMNRFQIRYEFKGVKDLIILLFTIVLITHIVACGWYFIGRFSYGSDMNNWVKVEGLYDKPWHIQYMSSFYWAIVTVMTVGYGDIVPHNYTERFFCLCVILFSSMILPYSINSIGLIIQDIQRDKKKFEYVCIYL